MTRKQFTDIVMKQILTIITTVATALVLIAFKAPFLFKRNVEMELSKKADKVEMYDELDKKVDKNVYDAHVDKQNGEYKALVEKIDDFNKNVSNRFNDIKDLIKANHKE